MSELRRQELKYFINRGDAAHLKSALSAVMMRDRNADSGGKYLVSSLYFETPDHKDFFEKLDGIHTRKKFRVRLYNKSTDVIKFETKFKHNSVIDKHSFPVSREECERLIKANYSANDSGPQLADNLILLKAFGYKPRVITEYYRTAFYLPFNEIRVTIDEDLSSYHSYVDLLNIGKRFSSEVYGSEIVCLEVKFSDHLPQMVKDILSSVPASRCSISKYCLSQKYITHSSWTDEQLPPF